MSNWVERIWVAKDGEIIRQNEAELKHGPRPGPTICRWAFDRKTRIPVSMSVEDLEPTVHLERKCYNAMDVAFHTREEVGDHRGQLPFSDQTMTEISAFIRRFG